MVGSGSLWLGLALRVGSKPTDAGAGTVLAVIWTLCSLPVGLAVGFFVVRPLTAAELTAPTVAFAAAAIGSYGILQGIPLGLGETSRYARTDIWRAAATLVGAAAVIAITESPTAVLLAIALGYTLSAVSLALRTPGARTLAWPRRSFVTAVFRDSLNAHVPNLLGIAVLRLDIVVLAFVATTAEVGLYSLASAFAEGVWLVPAAIGLVSVSDLARLSASDALAATNRGLRQAVAMGTLTAAVIGIVGSVVIDVALPQFRGAIAPLWISLAGAACYSVCQALSPYVIVGLRRPHWMTAITALTLATNIGLLFLLAPEAGAVGASTASSVAYALAALLAFTIFTRATRAQASAGGGTRATAGGGRPDAEEIHDALSAI